VVLCAGYGGPDRDVKLRGAGCRAPIHTRIRDGYGTLPSGEAQFLGHLPCRSGIGRRRWLEGIEIEWRTVMLGVTTVKTESEGQSASFPFSILPHSVHRGTMLASRPLMTADEVMALSGNKQLIFIQGMRPILAKKIRYFDWTEWRFWGKWDKWQG
jgi:hypothetical protein